TETSTSFLSRHRWVVVVLVMGVIAGASFYGWKQWQALQAGIEALTKSVAAMEREQDYREQALQARIDKLVDELARLRVVDRSDWLLAEAEYLLRLANQHAILGQDAPAAAALLTQADK